jgi:hypothetical protein
LSHLQHFQAVTLWCSLAARLAETEDHQQVPTPSTDCDPPLQERQLDDTDKEEFMPYAHITEFDFGDDRNTVNYDALGARLFDLGQPVGALHHSAGFDDHGVFRIYEVWKSLGQRVRFVEQTLQSLISEGPADPSHPYRPDREYGYELHTSFQ